jgi:hypothetical protein
MELTVEQMLVTRNTLMFTGDREPDGRPVKRSYNGEELSAYNWFVKNTKTPIEDYDKLYKEKLEKIVEDKKSKQEKKDVPETTQGLIDHQIRSAAMQELDDDEELITKFRKDKHNIELSDKTVSLLKKVYSVAIFNESHEVNGDLYELYTK